MDPPLDAWIKKIVSWVDSSRWKSSKATKNSKVNWQGYGIRISKGMVFCSSTILREVKLSIANIIWHYWIDRVSKSRKNALTYKRKKCCSSKTHVTSRWKRWLDWINYASNYFLIHETLQICPPATTCFSQTSIGKEIGLKWRNKCRNWGIFWEQREIV